MRVDFAAPADDGGTGILEYRIRHADNVGMTGATTVSTGTNRFATIGSLPPGAARYVQASARNGVGWGPWSSVGSAETISGGSIKRSGAWTAGRANNKAGGAWSPSVVMKK
ncbi:MAG: fibronectin type III domain-containing protein, partial [Microbacterium sp.]